MVKRHGFIPWIVLTLVGVFHILTAGQRAYGESTKEEGIWTFDYRDVFYDIAFLDPRKALIVGARGRMLVSHERYDRLWRVVDSGTSELLTCLDAVDHQNAWAGGHGGIILHSADGGRTWTTLRPPAPGNQPILDLVFVSPTVGYACGAYDTVLKTMDGGRIWQPVPTGVDVIYNGMAFQDETTGFLAGEFGTVMRTVDGGATWQRLDTGNNEGTFFGITRVSAQVMIVYGISGRLMRSGDNGETWTTVVTGVSASLYRAAANGKQVAVAGRSGTLLISTDSGQSFTARNDAERATLAGVSAHPEGGFVCVGERGRIIRIH